MDLHHIVDGLRPSCRCDGQTTKPASNHPILPPFSSFTKLCKKALIEDGAATTPTLPERKQVLPKVALQATPPLDGPPSPSRLLEVSRAIRPGISAASVPTLRCSFGPDRGPSPPFRELADAPIGPFCGQFASVPPPLAIPPRTGPFSPPILQPYPGTVLGPQIPSPVEDKAPVLEISYSSKRSKSGSGSAPRSIAVRSTKETRNLPASPPVSPGEDFEAKSSLVRETSSSRIPVVATLRVGRVEVDAATKRFGCQTCGRTFMRKSDLVRHERIHTGHRPNVCGVCGKRFIQRSALNVHLRVHTGEKPYRCRVCLRPFSDSSSLARHRKLHSQKLEDAAVLQMAHLSPDNLCGHPYKAIAPDEPSTVTDHPK